MWSFPKELYNRKPGSIVGGAGAAAIPTIKVPAVSVVDRIIASAKSIVGQKELPGNSGFKDPKFQERMKTAGWNKFESWCIYTAEDIWDNGMGPDHPLILITDKLFSGSATATWANFSHSDKFQTGKVPKPGALALYQYGNTWKGHGGVVIPQIIKKPSGIYVYDNVEGNSNSQGGREGIEVAEKVRQTGQPFKAQGLNLLGFVYAPEQ